ncbi:MAG: hypothetical protein IPL65_02330 [Lewinellaceae bacterium]|nr:hypothetical protein [Lewinellaceae bacterium]
MRTRLFLFLLALLPLALQAQIEDASDIFRELKGLDGVWFMPTDRGDRLEIWSVADDSTLIGRHVRIRIETGDTVTLETMRIERRADTVQFIAIVRGQNENKPVVFNLTTADYDGYVFENPEHDDPKKIIYRLLGNRELQVNTEGTRGSRTVKQEYVFEREFNPGAVQFRVRAGMNVFNMRQTGTLLTTPEFKAGPGWELGTTFAFKGRGGYITLNVDVGFLGRNVKAKSGFATVEQRDTGLVFVQYERDLTYRQAWLGFAVYPELTFRRDGRLSIYAGPYVNALLINRGKGLDLPGTSSVYDANSDFKRKDIGLLGGFQYKMNFTKKDLEGKLGIRATYGLSNIDALYTRGCNNPAYCNGSITLQGISLYYSINILKL